MLELYELILKIIHEPLRVGTIVALIIFIVDRIFRHMFLKYLRQFLHIKDRNGVVEHMERLNDIDRKLTLLMQERGIDWSQNPVQSLKTGSKASRSRSAGSSWRLRKMLSAVSSALNTTLFSGGHKMKLNKAILIPILISLAGAAKQLYGYEISDSNIDMAADAIIWITAIIGCFIHPHTKGTIDDAISTTLERSE